jgi:DNA-directed RNA polymerase beta' subunit
MIDFLDLNKFKKGLKPVKSTEYFSKPGEFHPDGLFSEVIFGPEESIDRKKTFSYLNLHTQVIHPTAFQLLTKLDMKIKDFLSSQETFSLDSNGTIQKDPNGVTGISEFLKLFPKIKFRGGTPDREKFIKKIEDAFVAKTLWLEVIPIIPPEQRPATQDLKGMWVVDPLNDYYISIMRKASQLKGAAKSSALYDLLNYEIQKSVLDHDKYIRTLIQKKRGLIRSQLLGKRTDFSGRAVITPGPNLKVNEIGIPLILALSLFEPFIIHRLFHSGQVDSAELSAEVHKFTQLELSIDSIKMVFKAIKARDNVPKPLYNIIFAATEVAMMNRVVLAKRDPVLHAEGVRPFKPILINGNTIQICALQVGGYNADFDGDTMGIFHPITNEAQNEIQTKMMRSEGGSNSNAVNFELSKEMGVGLYLLTKNIKRTSSPVAVTQKDLETAADPYIPVKFMGKNTTMGKAIFNATMPQGVPFYDGVVNKSFVNKLIPIVLKQFGQEVAINTFSALERIAFKFATIMAPSITLDDVKLSPELLILKKQLKGASVEEADAILIKMEKALNEHFKKTGSGIYDFVESGSTKGWGQPRQIFVAKGNIADPTGKVLPPIVGSFTEGLTNKEYFSAASGSRKGIIDRVVNTSDTGYMARKLAYVTNTVEIDRLLKDCKTTRTLDQRLNKILMDRLTGRYVIYGGKLVEYESSNFKIGDVVHLRSPVYCQSSKLCHTCYGKLLERHKSPYAGIIAAQLIGEAGTQTIMKTFHTGGAITLMKKDMIGDIIQNDPVVGKPVVVKYLEQQENFLIPKQDCTVTITVGDYRTPADLQFNPQKTALTAKGLVCTVEFKDAMFNIILDYPVILQVYNLEQIGKEFIKLHYQKNSTLLEASSEMDNTKKQVQYAERLISGREIFKDADHLYRKLLRVYAPLRDMDSVHLEVLLSQVLRDKTNLGIPARLGKKWDPVMLNIKQVVFKTSFIQGLAFENINEAIRTGLITEEPEETSVLEKVLTGTLAEGATK